MHPATTSALSTFQLDTVTPVPNKPKTKNRVLRVDEALWLAYGEACEAEGLTKADDLREHMRRKVRAFKRRQAQVAQPTTPDAPDTPAEA